MSQPLPDFDEPQAVENAKAFHTLKHGDTCRCDMEQQLVDFQRCIVVTESVPA